MNTTPIETHPLKPFLPKNARLLMLGSFPPPTKRWSMEFYYPNFNNDMWRIVGLLFFADKNHFVCSPQKAFDKEKLIHFLNTIGIALYDSACAIRRLRDNAADQYLEVVQYTDIPQLLHQIPLCEAIVTTGEKATQTLCSTLNASAPEVGGYSTFLFEGRMMRLYRMPSSSRAYPMALEKKAEKYKTLFSDLRMM